MKTGRIFKQTVPLPVLLGLVLACGTDEDDLLRPERLERVDATNNQTAAVESRLPEPLRVRARTSDQTLVSRAEIRWTLTDGAGASLSDTVTVTDGNGTAQVDLVLGPATGNYGVRAELVVDRSQAVLFDAQAVAGPEITAVAPGTFSGGETLTVSGTAFGNSPRLEVGGVLARVTAATPNSITAVAPYCLVPGPVQVTALVGTASSNPFTVSYQAGTGLDLAVGEYVSIVPSQVENCAVFPPAGADDIEYLVSAQSVTGTPGQTAAYELIGDSVVQVVTAPPVEAVTETWAQTFERFLREREEEIAALPKPPREESGLVLAPEAVDVGDERTFRVCSDIACNAEEDFAEVRAEAQFVGDNVVIYQDREAPAGGFGPADFDSLGTLFDTDLYPVGAQAFGSESDVDRNGRVVILLTPVVNGLTPTDRCEESIVTGFFFGIDIDPSFAKDNRSNKAEIFYSLVPDPDGTVTCELSTNSIRRLVPTTFIHEFQHMISYNQHVLVRGNRPEILWLNEALSHISEELAGLRFRSQGNDDRFSQFLISNVFNAFKYLKDPGGNFVLPSEGSGSLAERGASWLFVRWLLDNFGESLTRRLVETDLRGAENVAAQTGEPFARLLSEWNLANYVSDLPEFEAPGRLRFTSWEFRQTFGSLHEQAPETFDRPFPLEPPTLPGGRFTFGGTLRSGSGDYLLVTQSAGEKGFALEFEDPGGGAVSGTVVPRLNVIRLR